MTDPGVIEFDQRTVVRVAHSEDGPPAAGEAPAVAEPEPELLEPSASASRGDLSIAGCRFPGGHEVSAATTWCRVGATRAQGCRGGRVRSIKRERERLNYLESLNPAGDYQIYREPRLSRSHRRCCVRWASCVESRSRLFRGPLS